MTLITGRLENIGALANQQVTLYMKDANYVIDCDHFTFDGNLRGTLEQEVVIEQTDKGFTITAANGAVGYINITGQARVSVK